METVSDEAHEDQWGVAIIDIIYYMKTIVTPVVCSAYSAESYYCSLQKAHTVTVTVTS